MGTETVIRRLEKDTLDCVRTDLTRGTSQIVLVDPDNKISPSDVRGFLSRLNCDEYDLYDEPADDSEIDWTSLPEASCLVLSRNTDRIAQPRPGIDNDLFRDNQGPTTDFNLRLVDIGYLQVQEKMTVWDIGAGTGSVCIESARLNPSARYHAIESDTDRLETLKDNIHSMGTYNVRPVEGMAPAVFDQLPDPDRVFIGGTLGHLDGILEGVHQALENDGLIVANFLRMDFVRDSLSFLSERDYETKLIQLMAHEFQSRNSQGIEWQEGPAFPLLTARKQSNDG